MNEIDREIAKELVSQTAGEAYKDIAHPTAQATGQIASFVPRTIRLWFGKWEKWIINGEYSIKETERLLEAKLKNISEEKIVEPESYVAIPAIQQLSYSMNSEELRELYANLLVSSMNVDTKWQVHPGFVDIIKQLTPDEAKLLRFLSKQTIIPTVDVKLVYSEKNRGYRLLKRNCLVLPENTVESYKNIPMYIDNLVRQRLIDIPNGIHYTSPGVYDNVEQQEKILGSFDGKIEYERKIIEVTSFGKKFVDVCMS